MPVIIGKDNNLKKRATCRHCGTIHEYWPNDIRTLHSGRDISGGSDGADGFNCMSCGKEIYTRTW